MAKAKIALTPEERLEQALVPEGEWPYEVPGNWVWCHLGNIFDMQAGKNINAKDINDVKQGEFQYQCFGGNGIRGYTKRYNRSGMFPLIGRQGALCGNINFATGDFYATEHAVVVSSSNGISLRWAYYLLVELDLNQYATSIAQPGLAVSKIMGVPFPLPPIPEQRRIVERIESLFEKLDRAKELAQSALDSFETRKAAILHKAFTGELTAKWRKENCVGIESWENTSIGQICTIGSGGTPSRANPLFYEGNIPWVKTGEIDWNTIESTEEHITAEAIENSSAKMFPSGTVLVAMYGQGLTRGRTAILKIDATTNQAVCALMPSGKALNYFIYYYFMCNYWALREKAVGGNQPNFSGTMISKFPLHLPSLPEQKEIVRILDSLSEKEQRARELYDVIDKIDLMKKAILTRAFRGELGTNDPSEESAMGLLMHG